jgi:DNA-binding NarL/FixJ family response regulator
MNGERYFPPAVLEAVRKFTSSPDAFFKILSNAEQAVIRQMADGWADEQIAATTGLSANTIHSHRSSIMRKLDIHSFRDLARWAADKGFAMQRPPMVPE